MEFFNIGGGEILVIILLALVLFRPEDIYKAMHQLGRYTRSARLMWREFMDNMRREMDAQEVEEALKETRASIKETQKALDSLETSVSDVKKTVEKDVSEAGRSLKSQASESARALKAGAARSTGMTAAAARVTAATAAATAAAEEADEAISEAITATKKASSFTEQVAARVRAAQAKAATEMTSEQHEVPGEPAGEATGTNGELPTTTAVPPDAAGATSDLAEEATLAEEGPAPSPQMPTEGAQPAEPRPLMASDQIGEPPAIVQEEENGLPAAVSAGTKEAEALPQRAAEDQPLAEGSQGGLWAGVTDTATDDVTLEPDRALEATSGDADPVLEAAKPATLSQSSEPPEES